jgi:hypothetical protein
VFDAQCREHGLTQTAVEETIRICKDKNVLKKYLENKESEVVSIMMNLFDEEQIMKTYARDLQKQAVKDTARRMIAMGKMTLEEVGECVPALTMAELREIEAEVMDLV